MTEMDKLTQKVKDGITHHNMTCSGACSSCPYKESFGTCVRAILNDANEVINYWKGKYENTVLQQPMMIIDPNPAPSIIKVESGDIYRTKKYSKALQEIADAGKQATEALNDVTKALKDFKEVFSDELPKITEPVNKAEYCIIAKCAKCRCHYDASLNSDCPNCKAVMTGVE